MKPVEEIQREVFVDGMSETKGFTFSADNPFLMRDLLTRIYSKPEKSVVRELMANAFDAHVANGKVNEPIRVWLPTSLDPNFVVRDFGEGMSHDFVMNLFSSIGTSTKTTTNAQTGMFGVGSKSPLGVTDSYAIRCYDPPSDAMPKGQVRLYTISIQPDGRPQISHAFNVDPREKDMVERGGVEVKVPISNKRREKLLEGMSSQHFCWFDKPVEFDGSFDEIQGELYVSIVELVPGLHIGTTRDNDDSSEWQVFARQGAAVYPLKEDELRHELSEEATSVLKTLSDTNRHLLFTLPIGTAGVTMGREELAYDDKTRDSIVLIMEQACLLVQAQLEETIGDARNYIAARDRLVKKYAPETDPRKAKKRNESVRAMLIVVRDKIKANYLEWHKTLPDEEKVEPAYVDGVRQFDDNNQLVMMTIKVRPRKWEPQERWTMAQGDMVDGGKVLMHVGKLYRDRWNESVSYEMGDAVKEFQTELDHILFVIPHHMAGWQERIREWCKQNYEAKDLPFSASYGEKPIQLLIVRCAKKNMDNVFRAFDLRGNLNVSVDFEKLPELTGADAPKQRSSSRTSVYQFNGSTFDEIKVEPKPGEVAYYVTRVGVTHEVTSAHPEFLLPGTARKMREQFSQNDLSLLISTMRKLGLLDRVTPIYRLTPKQSEQLKDDPNNNFIHLFNMIAPMVEAQVIAETTLELEYSNLTSSNYFYQISDVLRGAFDGTASNERRELSFGIIDKMCRFDPVFKYVAAVRWAGIRPEFYPLVSKTAEDVRRIGQLLFGAETNFATKGAYDALNDEYRRRYQDIARYISSGYEVKYGYYFISGFVQHEVSKPYNLAGLEQLTPLVTKFEDLLDTTRKQVYPTATVQIPGAISNAA